MQAAASLEKEKETSGEVFSLSIVAAAVAAVVAAVVVVVVVAITDG